VLFISGDVHFGEITRFDCGAEYPSYDVTSSGLTQSVENSVPEVFQPLMRLLAILTPTTMRVLSPNCQYKSCTIGTILSWVEPYKYESTSVDNLFCFTEFLSFFKIKSSFCSGLN
jgi:hypothetical protein